MSKIIRKSILASFYLLIFLVPLVLYTKSSELFEFNKMVLTYALTTIIVTLWAVRMISEKRFIFSRSALDIILLIYLFTQFLSSIISLDTRTSFLGYYSRFNGGFASSLSYCLLYWAFASNVLKKQIKMCLYVFLSSTLLVSIYGILEHLGIDKNIWVQDVQNRVFSTLGQPNWLAAWIVAILPVTWSLALINFNLKNKNKLIISSISILLNLILFLCLTFTKSRSGYLGLGVAFVIYFSIFILKFKSKIASYIIPIGLLLTGFLIVILLSGTPWTPSVYNFLKKSSVQSQNSQVPQGPVLETGGTESGTIRKIVWKGAIDIWKHYPIFGTGLETFAFSYYNFRPIEHNNVSEWDYLYNKAHNEYLNYLSTTGIVGSAGYISLIVGIAFVILKNKKIKKRFGKGAQKVKIDSTTTLLKTSFFAGFSSVLVTNFFGFSVVPVNLEFFLFPAFSFVLSKPSQPTGIKSDRLDIYKKVIITIVVLMGLLVLNSIIKYWRADYYYALGKSENDTGNYALSREHLIKSLSYSPNESIFWDELSQVSASISISLLETDKKDLAQSFANEAITQSIKAVSLSPKNVNIRRNQASLYIKLSVMNPNYIVSARQTILETIELAPTDAKLYYNLALVYARTDELDMAQKTLEKTLELRSKYREARIALGILLAQKGDKKGAREQFNFVLENINPNDTLAKEQLLELDK